MYNIKVVAWATWGMEFEYTIGQVLYTHADHAIRALVVL